MGDGRQKSHIKIAYTTTKYFILFLILTVITGLYSISLIMRFGNNSIDVRNLRIQLSDVVAYAENGEFDKLDAYRCTIIDTNSTVIYSNTDVYRKEDKVNLHSLSIGISKNGTQKVKQFIIPLVKNDVQQGTLIVFLTGKDDVTYHKFFILFTPFFISLIIIIFMGTRLCRYIRKEIIIPVCFMSDLSKNILHGDYTTSFPPCSENEVGKLCNEMELLRDELYNSSAREKALRSNEQMLLACISHDLKTPITTISGCAEGIRDGIVKDDENIKKYAQTILAKSELLTKMINNIIEHTSTERNEFVVHREETYAGKFIQDTIASLNPDIQRSGLTLSLGTVPDLLLYIDPIKIYQVFQNIIENAIKYTPKGGRINIEFEQKQKWLFVSISDNGQGIAATDIPFVFDQFFRGEKARTQNCGGSGLGLSIVKNIIEHHAGKAYCDSILGKGTTIVFSLPLA